MAVCKDATGWTADFFENGHSGRRIRKQGFATEAAARCYEADFIAFRILTGWPLDEHFSDLVLLWYDRHGRSLAHHKTRLLRTLVLVERLGDPLLADFDAQVWAHYRKARLKVVPTRLLEREQCCLSAVFADLIRLGDWVGMNPFADICQLAADRRIRTWPGGSAGDGQGTGRS